jgi:hypothetical protein
MKKLLVFLLVLGMTSTVQAGFILSADGQTDISEITLDGPSSYLELGIGLLADDMLFNGGDIAIQLSNAQGALSYSGLIFPNATMRTKGVPVGVFPLSDNMGFAGAYAVVPGLSGPQKVVISGGDISLNAKNNSVLEGPWGGGYIPAVAANSYPILMQGLLFHCEEPTDVTISLVAAGLGITRLEYDAAKNVIGQTVIYAPGTVMDSIIVHQIPEPMTMSLLGLGGLALLRRRRA